MSVPAPPPIALDMTLYERGAFGASFQIKTFIFGYFWVRKKQEGESVNCYLGVNQSLPSLPKNLGYETRNSLRTEFSVVFITLHKYGDGFGFVIHGLLSKRLRPLQIFALK